MESLAIFVKVADLGSFSAAASALGSTASSVSRTVSRLEDQLGFRLLHRTTRSLSLTLEGTAYLETARDVLDQLRTTAEGLASQSQTGGRVRGSLRVNTGTAYARHVLVPLLRDFGAHQPNVKVDLSVSDQRIDPIAEQIDVTIRIGPLTESDLIGIRLGTVRRVIAASPRYLAAHGTPAHPSELVNHNCLLMSGFRRLSKWPMQVDGRSIRMAVAGSLTADSAEVLLDLAIAGAGIVRFGDFLGAQALQDGRLVSLLNSFHDPDPQPITALVPRERRNLPAVAAFLAFIKERTA